jgi:ABC-type transport system involved in cytochrome c biogenesis permease subunit
MFSNCQLWGDWTLQQAFSSNSILTTAGVITVKIYRFFVPTWNLIVGQGQFRNDAQVKKVLQQLTDSIEHPVEFEEISELNPDLPMFSSSRSQGFEISTFIILASLLGLFIGIILFQGFMLNQAAQAIDGLFLSLLQ